MAQSKKTKKFEKRHLTDTLKRRKEFSKVKQRHQLNAKKKAKKAGEHDSDDDNETVDRPVKKQKSAADDLADMTVDDFFAGEIPLPEKSAKSRKADKKAEKKRKRDEDEDNDSVVSDPVAFDSDEGVDPDAAAGDDIGTHASDLKELAKKDPEFYKYLQDNDAELLDFAETADLAEVDELSGSETEKQSGKKKAKAKKEGEIVDGKISTALVAKWTIAMTEQNSLRSMREIVLAFRAAAHLNEESAKQYKYTISSADVYHQVVTGALKHVPTVLAHHLPVKTLPNGKIRLDLETKKFRNLTPLLKSHTVSLQHLLANLSDPATIKLTLTSILELSPYILSFKKAVREVVKGVVEIWSDASQSESIRISAFLILRRLCTIADQGIKEYVLRTTYQGLIKSSRHTTIYNISGINLMKNSGLELWGLVEPQISYTTGFTFIRQLAIHLRNSIKNNSNESYKAVYNWQYVHSLDFWSRVLSTHCETLREAISGKESPLRPLLYPLTQVTLGAMRLIPTAAYFPLRFHLVRALIRLSAATNTFIPLAAPLYEVLQSAEMKKPPKPSTLKPLDFETNVRAAKSYLRTRVYQDGVGDQVVELLADFYHLWCKNIAFPELALPVIVMLRRWVKEVAPHGQAPKPALNGHKFQGKGKGGKGGKSDEGKGNRNVKVTGMITLLVQKLEANSKFIEEKRAKVEFAPNDRAGVEGFLKDFETGKTPLGAFVEGQRKQREARKKILEESRRDEDAKRKREKNDEGAGVADGFDGESDGSSGNESEEEEEEEVEDEEEEEMEFEEERELDDDEVEILVS